MPRNKKELKGPELDRVLRMRPDEITLTRLRAMFADTEERAAEYNPQDTFTLPAKKLWNDAAVRTNLGRFVVNMFVLAPLKGALGYRNVPLDQKAINSMIAEATTRMTENRLHADDYVDFMERLTWLGYSTAAFTIPGFGLDGVRCPPKTAALKVRLLRQHRAAIEAGDPVVIDAVEKELLAAARAELRAQGSPSLEYYESGARGDFNNNYKNMAVMRGLVADPQHPGKFLVGKSSLFDGTSPEEQHVGSSILIQGAGGRAIDTRKSGYMSKQLTAAFQGIVLDVDGSDCGSTRTLKVRITPANAGEFRLRYAATSPGKLVLLDSEKIKEFYGKDVHLRSPMFCRTPAICEKCYGRLPFELGIVNVGMTYNAVGERLKGLSMKQFHNSTVHLGEVDLDRAISPE
jgi:hypothetical protein